MKESKNLFITVGSTQFESLIHHLLNKEVLSLLFNNHFETVNLQVGNTKVNQNELLKLKNEFKNKMTINLFDFNQSLTHFYREADFVISHAGSGSIIEALRLKKKLLVVVNNKLMDNHQKELAIEMKKNNYSFICEPETLKTFFLSFDEYSTFSLEPFPDKRTGAFQEMLNTIL